MNDTIRDMKTVDVIIPVYKPDDKFKRLLRMLDRQTYPVSRVIIINTEEKYFNAFFYGTRELEKYHNLLIRHISAFEFDHGKTRRYGVSLSDADYFICMTDDAVPEDTSLVENLLKPLEEGKAAVSYARQLPGKHAPETERFSRQFNYPEKSKRKTSADLKKLGIKTFFCSNVCAAYNREIYEELGGFEKHIIFNEDMVFASKVIDAGYAIQYCAEAKVIHSHHYNNLQQFKRNFDLGVSQACYPEIFSRVSSTGEGKKLVRQTAEYLRKKKMSGRIFGMYVTSAYKYFGYQCGKHYTVLPKKLVLKFTSNPVYWQKDGEEAIRVNVNSGFGRSGEEDSWNRNLKILKREPDPREETEE